MAEELAFAKGVGFGMRDADQPILWFGVETISGGSLQCFGLEEAGNLIKSANCYDIKELEGKPCIVESKNGFMRFVRWK